VIAYSVSGVGTLLLATTPKVSKILRRFLMKLQGWLKKSLFDETYTVVDDNSKLLITFSLSYVLRQKLKNELKLADKGAKGVARVEMKLNGVSLETPFPITKHRGTKKDDEA
jgi:hypothetical protein